MASVKSGLESRKGSSSEVRNVRTRLLIWRSVTIGLSFLSLILILSKLHSVCKEVKFLQSVQSEWLPKQGNLSSGTGKPMSPQVIQLENLRQDLHVLIIELWSARTTLILGLIFVLSHILSWAWITYQLESGVSLKNVLLLVVFAAVDIAASTGFIMVRVITTVISSTDFPRDIRVVRDQDQIPALASIRLSVLQSSSGSTDIFVSGLVAFLTGVRVYIVICAVTFYNRFRKDPAVPVHLSSYSPHKYKSGINEESESQSVKIIDDLLKPQGNYMTWNKVAEGNKETLHKEMSNSTRKFSISTESVTGEEETPASTAGVSADDFRIQAADMPIHMQRAALNGAIQACRLYTTEKHIAESIKQDFDQMFGATWHCIVGRNWGSCVTHSKQCYIRILYKDFTILLYKST